MKFNLKDKTLSGAFCKLIGNYGFAVCDDGLDTYVEFSDVEGGGVKFIYNDGTLEYKDGKLNYQVGQYNNKPSLQITVTKKSQVFWALKQFSDFYADKPPVGGNKFVYKPKFKDLTYMLDCSRNAVYKVETVKDVISQLAVCGYTSIMLYTEDTYKVDDYPYFGYLRNGYTKEDLKEIDEYAQTLGLELIPCIQTLAHFNTVTRYPAMDRLFDCNDILLVGEEETYKFIESLISTCANCFTSRRINIGMDEAYMLGRGRYLEKHGFEKRFDIMKKHLKKVNEICEKYGFKPMMWSDMFFFFVSGEHCNSGEVTYKGIVPENVSLVYWNYWDLSEEKYDVAMKQHRNFDNELIFAGGAWKWLGFAPDNRYSLKAMEESTKACVKNNVDHYIVTGWGDNGAETSCFAVLPAIFYQGYINYHGYEVNDPFKKAFKSFSGMELDDFLTLDLANRVTKNDDINEKTSAAKYLLFNDVLLGTLDTIIEKGQNELYAEHAERLGKVVEKAGKWAYIFKTQQKLCKVLSIKAEIGINLREAYKNGDKERLQSLLMELKILYTHVTHFYFAFSEQWEKEARPNGFDVQDIRIGALKQRILTAIHKVDDYLKGYTDRIGELEEELLCFMGHGKDFEKDFDQCEYRWRRMTSVNVND